MMLGAGVPGASAAVTTAAPVSPTKKKPAGGSRAGFFGRGASEGIELHFNDYQVGPHGLPVITVPWAVFDGIRINNVP